MRLLLDQNLSFKLVGRLGEAFEGSVHVADVGLTQADDETVWSYAAEHGLIIVSKDADFYERSVLLGPPPKVVWLRLGNCTTSAVEECLTHHVADIRELSPTQIVPSLCWAPRIANTTRMAENEEQDDLRTEYDLSQLRQRGERGQYAERYREGTNLVRLEPDVAAVFQSEEAVNKALRTLIEIARREVPQAS